MFILSDSAVYKKLKVMIVGSVISQRLSPSSTQCAARCLRLLGISFNYEKDKNLCIIYSDLGGNYQEV